MSVSLQKGQKVSLSKDNAGLSKVMIGLGWDEVQQKKKGFFSAKPQDIDCDASAFLLIDGKLRDKKDIVYFGNLRHPSGTVQHMGDNLTGAGEGDDEQILVDLAQECCGMKTRCALDYRPKVLCQTVTGTQHMS